jgi:hypothetical protein
MVELKDDGEDGNNVKLCCTAELCVATLFGVTFGVCFRAIFGRGWGGSFVGIFLGVCLGITGGEAQNAGPALPIMKQSALSTFLGTLLAFKFVEYFKAFFLYTVPPSLSIPILATLFSFSLNSWVRGPAMAACLPGKITKAKDEEVGY